MSRPLRRLALAVLTLLCAGCAAVPGPLKKLVNGASDQSLRKQVEADSFPTAQRVGL